MVRSYRFDKEHNNTHAFFKEAFIGSPCFNGRLIALLKYAEKQGFDVGTYAYTTEFDTQANELSEFMYPCAAHFKLKEKPTMLELRNYAKELKLEKLQKLLDSVNIQSIYSRAREFYVD